MTPSFERIRSLNDAGEFLERLSGAALSTAAQKICGQARHIPHPYSHTLEIGLLAKPHQRSRASFPMLGAETVPSELCRGYRR